MTIGKPLEPSGISTTNDTSPANTPNEQKLSAMPSKRQFLVAASALYVEGYAATAQAAVNTIERENTTPGDVEGPFYPPVWNGDIDNNLRVIDGQTMQIGAMALTLAGQVFGANGTPANNARVAIWQCDAKGRYRHPSDAGDAPLTEGFQGYGEVMTDHEGRYRFETIKPAPYGSRPAHVHFRIEHENTILITQMYFAGENQEGGLFGRARSLWQDQGRQLQTVKPVLSELAGNPVLTADFLIRL